MVWFRKPPNTVTAPSNNVRKVQTPRTTPRQSRLQSSLSVIDRARSVGASSVTQALMRFDHAADGPR